MARTVVKTQALHFSLFAESKAGKDIMAEVVEFVGASSQVVFSEAAADVAEAQRKCEEYVKQRMTPTFNWTTPQFTVSSVTT